MTGSSSTSRVGSRTRSCSRPPRDGVLRVKDFRSHWFNPAARSVGLEGIVPHELRHHGSFGASVKAVQSMLGHASAAMTLDLYGHLFGDALDDVAALVDVVARAAGVSRPDRGLAVVELRARWRWKRASDQERRDRDSNPGCLRTTVFKTAPFGRSGIPPVPRVASLQRVLTVSKPV
jgi:hypothetical protein